MKSESNRVSRLRPRPLMLPLLFSVVLSVPLVAGTAQAWPLEWSNPEVVDTGVAELSSASGHSAVHTPRDWTGGAEWHVVYAKEGEIWHRVRTATGWLDPERLTEDPADSREPQAAFGASELLVVWEDDRTGHAEVWAKSWNGTTWSSEECLAEDGVPSRHPALASIAGGALVVWEEQLPAGRCIQGRMRAAGSWGEVQTISQSSGEAFQPALAPLDLWAEHTYYVVWSDTRDANPSIYLRPWSVEEGLRSEVRVTNMTGVSQHPAAQAGYCCWDTPVETLAILFENISPGGVPEVWRLYYYEYDGGYPDAPVLMSEDDGLPSAEPALANVDYWWGSFPGLQDDMYSYATWREDHSAPCHPVWRFDIWASPTSLGNMDLGAACPSTAALSASDELPYATVGALWTEQSAGGPTLVLRLGRTMSCYAPSVSYTHPGMIAPEGFPADTVTVVTDCGGVAPVAGVSVNLTFGSAPIWDVTQPHPDTAPQLTDGNGKAVFSVRAGGCRSGEYVSYKVNGSTLAHWRGIRSPDINGDCQVTLADLHLLQSVMGTTDPCADLDLSGLVTETDEAIVEATMGDRCTQNSSEVGSEPDRPALVGLRIAPNPSSGVFALRFELSRQGPVSVWVVDAGGRLIRELTAGRFYPGPAVLVWDGREGSGRSAPAGVYFALVRTDGETLRKAMLLIH